jgi:hypothetical protein
VWVNFPWTCCTETNNTTSVVGKQSARAMRFGWFSCICMVIICPKRRQTRTCECDMGTWCATLHAAYVRGPRNSNRQFPTGYVAVPCSTCLGRACYSSRTGRALRQVSNQPAHPARFRHYFASRSFRAGSEMRCRSIDDSSFQHLHRTAPTRVDFAPIYVCIWRAGDFSGSMFPWKQMIVFL